MNTYLEYRKSKRFEHKATVMLEVEPDGYFSYGQMINYSDDGMLIGSDAVFKLGTKIKINFDKPLYKAAPKTYRATVKWCNELSAEDAQYHYGIGLKYD